MLSLLLITCFASPSPLLEFSLHQWAKTPEMRIEDAYKWLFHATLGGEHAVTEDAGPRRWMDLEWVGLQQPQAHEPDVVPLRPDGTLVRVNLRPYKVRGGDKEMMLAVFVESAKRFRHHKHGFVREWLSLGNLLKRRNIRQLTRTSWKKLDVRMQPRGYPAIEHSAAYESLYQPAYRVVLRELLTE